MERYKNLVGDSIVVGYEIGEDYIDIQFQGGWIYLYTYQSTGKSEVDHMKNLALTGCGLNSYISKFAKRSYASKRR
jgi:hypothetical protein